MQRFIPLTGTFMAALVSLAPASLLAAAPVDPAPAQQLAAERGCYNCHGQPPRRNIPSFTEISRGYAALRAKPGAEQQARDRMHHGGLFSHVAAHERLTEAEATLLVHWLFSCASGPEQNTRGC